METTNNSGDRRPNERELSGPARTFRDFLRWRFTSRPTPWPKAVQLAPQPAPPQPHGDEIVATWLGHASFLVQTRRGNVLFDPVFSERVSPLSWIGPRRVHPVPLPLEALPRIDAVCVSHDHYDHFDKATLCRLARAHDAVFIAPLRHRDLLERVGAKRIVELDWWETHALAGGLEVSLTPTKHWSNRIGTRRNHRLWGGFWLEWRNSESGETGASSRPSTDHHEAGETPALPPEQRHVWFAGDTGYDDALFREIRERCDAPDLALLPIGAYEPRWFMAPMHMNPDEAVRVHRDIGARRSLAMHWGTFQLTDEGREEPARALEAAKRKYGIPPDEFRVMQPGESEVFGARKPHGT